MTMVVYVFHAAKEHSRIWLSMGASPGTMRSLVRDGDRERVPVGIYNEINAYRVDGYLRMKYKMLDRILGSL